MKRTERLGFAKAVLDEFARASSGSGEDPVLELRHIAAYSDDVKARLQAVRMLAGELEGDAVAERPTAKWAVVRIPPKGSSEAA